MVALFVPQLVLSSRIHQFFPVQHTPFMYLEFFLGGEGGSHVSRYSLIWPKVHLQNQGICGTDSVIPLTVLVSTQTILWILNIHCIPQCGNSNANCYKQYTLLTQLQKLTIG
jgi:hypothetical protein